MNEMSRTLLFIFIIPIGLLAQKKPLSHDDYDRWKTIRDWKISRLGNYAVVQTDPLRGDGYLQLFDLKNNDSLTFQRGYGARISHNENYLVLRVKPPYAETREARRKELKKDQFPKDHLVIHHIASGVNDTIRRIESFAMPERHEGELAVMLAAPEADKEIKEKEEEGENEKQEGKEKKKKKKKPESIFMVRNLKGSRADTLNKVKDYVFAREAPVLLYTLKDDKNDSIHAIYKYESGTSHLLDSSGVEFILPALSDDGTSLSWLSTRDSAEAKVRKYSLKVYSGDRQFTINPGFPAEGRMPSPYSGPVFSEDGQQLFFKTTAIPPEIEEDTMLIKNEKVKLDIWSWTDTIIQPAQVKNLEKDKEKSFLAVLHLEDGKAIQLESHGFTVRYNRKNVTEWLAASDDRAFQKNTSWEYPVARDLYMVNIHSGEKRLVGSGLKAYPRMSPGGNYLYWYDRRQKAWSAYDVSSGDEIRLNQFKEAVWNEEHDQPSEPGTYGIGGWTKKDKRVLVYDQYDIWSVDPENPGRPERITNGREEHLVYRLYPLDDKIPHLPEATCVVSIRNKITKEQGFAEFDFRANEMIRNNVNFGPHSFRGIEKAKDGERMLFRMGNFENYPEVYHSTDLEERVQLTRTNIQQKEYNWGTAELVSWKAKGNKLQGILYKPENFDPAKKYPMIVYFYERYSDLVYNHFDFKPSASTVNFAYFVSNGYLVFVPDIVYKVGEPGRSAFNCVVSGTRELMKRPYVDGENIGIQGQSWGGYQVAYLITQTDLYKCAMAGAPVSNMTSAYGGIRWGSGWSRMFQYERTQSRLGLTLWDDTDLYIENSPLFFADEINTPLLIMHNDNDGAVPWYQGIEYFLALRRLNKPAWMLVYNGEAHNLRKLHNKKDLSQRMSQFFDHYLKGAAIPVWMESGRKAVDKETKDAFGQSEKR